MNQEDILVVLPESGDDAKSLKEIALARWGSVALERRQREEGHKFWYNAYWKTKPVGGKGGPGVGALE